MVNCWPETVSVAPSGRPAKVPVIAEPPVLLMIVNGLAAGRRESAGVTLSLALSRLMAPPTCNWLYPEPGVAPLMAALKVGGGVEGQVPPVSVSVPVVASPGLTVAAVVVIEATVPVPPIVVPESAATAPLIVPSACSTPALMVVVPV